MKQRSPLVSIASLAATAMLMAGCGGGGGSALTSPVASHPAAAKATPPPAAANRTPVGTASITINYPHVLHAKSAQALVARSAKAKATARPQFVDPTSGNLIDVYVDGTFEPNLDGMAGSNDSLIVQTTTTGQQTLVAPVYSTNLNDIVMIEYASDGSTVLALGETNVGSFTAGSQINVSITLQMNVTGVGVVDIPNQSNPQLMSSTAGSSSYTECFSPQLYGFYPADALGMLLTSSGVGGVSAPAISGTSENGGTTTLAGSLAGVWTLTQDTNYDAFDAVATDTNPAWAIYNDVFNNTNNNYYYGAQDNYNAGPNQGFYNLADYFYNYKVYSALNAAGTEFITGYTALNPEC